MAAKPQKMVIDCSAPDRDVLKVAVGEQVQAAIDAASRGELTPEAMTARLLELGELANEVAALPDSVTKVDLDADEIAQRQTDETEAAAALDLRRGGALAQIRMKRDRLLAQTDVLALPPEAMPTDFPADRLDEISKNQRAWLTFRQQLRDYPATVEDPFDPPPFPEQPAKPAITLT